jgi:adenosylhomocysteinase
VSFANQALSVEDLVREQGRLERKVTRVPAGTDRGMAWLGIASTGVRVHGLVRRPQEYLASWTNGT